MDFVVDEKVTTELDDAMELLFDDVDEAVERSDNEVDTIGAAWYIFRRDLPPQYSLALAAHTMLQPLTLGTELVWFTEPAFITFPQ
jgi:hypothetical protein